MNRRTFSTLTGLTMLGALGRETEPQILGSNDSVGQQTLGPEVVLEDDQLLVAFNEHSGAITRLTRKLTGWTIQRRPELDVSFRMLTPMPHQRSNFIFGHKRKAERVERISDHEVHLECPDFSVTETINRIGKAPAWSLSRLSRYIDDCAGNGVTAIQLVGWNIGNQDGGDPSQDADPGLGTWEELKQAVAYANSKGIKMIMFGKILWADLTTELYKKELYKYAATDPFGIEYQTGGFSYTTPTQLAGINNRRRAIMDVQCQAYRDFATREFEKILKFGAAGWLFDEVCHHGPVEYSFSKTHGYAAPKFIYGSDIPLAAQFRAAADKVDPDFVFAGEGPQDWLLQYYPISYFRIDNNSRPVCRLLDPQAPLVVAVTGLDDREKLNLIFLNRYIISYEPFNFKGHLTDFPLTLAYGQKIDALRKRYKAQLWDAEFRDSPGASVKATGLYRYSVFVQPDGKRSVVVINTELQKSITVTVDLPNAGRLVKATPEDPEEKKSTGQINISARSAAVSWRFERGSHHRRFDIAKRSGEKWTGSNESIRHS